jgi:peptide deformylase
MNERETKRLILSSFKEHQNFIKNNIRLEDIEILAQRTDDHAHAVVYKIKKNNKHVIYEISFFEKDEFQNFQYSHKYDLSKLYEKYCSIQENKLCIRQMGDKVLHCEARPVDFTSHAGNEINKQITLLKNVLSKTGGIGIAANQCLQLDQPLKIILVGVDYQNQEHLIKAISRYPSVLFPELQVYINPIIIEASNEYSVFPEGCLSVTGILRALVLRPTSVTIRYQDRAGHFHEKKFIEMDARIMLHEMDHIRNGKVYIQRIIEEFSHEQLIQVEKIFSKRISDSKNNSIMNAFQSPVIVFKRDQNNKLIFDESDLTEILKKMPAIALQGIHSELINELKKRIEYS